MSRLKNDSERLLDEFSRWIVTIPSAETVDTHTVSILVDNDLQHQWRNKTNCQKTLLQFPILYTYLQEYVVKVEQQIKPNSKSLTTEIDPSSNAKTDTNSLVWQVC